jgi:hypothetical protein
VPKRRKITKKQLEFLEQRQKVSDFVDDIFNDPAARDFRAFLKKVRRKQRGGNRGRVRRNWKEASLPEPEMQGQAA